MKVSPLDVGSRYTGAAHSTDGAFGESTFGEKALGELAFSKSAFSESAFGEFEYKYGIRNETYVSLLIPY